MFKAITKFFIRKNISVKKYQKKLIRYIRKKDIKRISRLIDCGLDVTFNNNQALYTCGIWNFTKGVELLLKAGADPNRIGILALRHKNIEMINLLIEYGWDVTSNDNEAIRKAAGECKGEIIEALIKAGADITANNNEPLKMACFYGLRDNIKLLIENGADMYAEDLYCLKTALLNDNKEIVEIFVEKGYKADEKIIDFAEYCYARKEIVNILESTMK